jgi:NADP-dependent 3-hydroxy acid dehydrogenase YdfG
MTLEDRRIVVVGASAGIGRAVATRAVQGGAAVTLVARRLERLAEVAEEAGGGTPVQADVRDHASCADAMRRSGEVLGGIDTICFCAGTAPLAMLAHTDDAAWRNVFETNVIGANHVIRTAVPYMTSSSVVMAMSSEVTLVPRPGLGAYGASKAALRSSLASWRLECPGIRFCSVTVGSTQPTEFGGDFDVSLLGVVLEDWVKRGLVQDQMMSTDDVASVLISTIANLLEFPEVGMDELVLRSPSGVAGTMEAIISGAAGRHDREHPQGT